MTTQRPRPAQPSEAHEADARLVSSIDLDAPAPPPPPKKPAAWKTWLRRALILGVVGGATGAVALAGAVVYYSRDLPKFDSVADYTPLQTTKVLGSDGSVVGEIFAERRTVVPVDDIPSVMVQALVSAEDANFFEHSGIDWIGTVKAFVGNLRPGAHTRGASTLTQQTVKTLLLSNERTYGRKIKEAILSLRLERNLRKQDILYLYLNQIYFGNRRYGIEEAARYYFGKSVKDISIGEAAVLASIPKSPNELNPRRNMKRAKERQIYVLKRMVVNGYVTAEVAQREIEKPIVVAPLPEVPPGGYYVEEVRRLLMEQLGEQVLTGGGLRIETWMDPALQESAEKATQKGLRALDKRQGFRGPLAHLDEAGWKPLRDKAVERHVADGENGRQAWSNDQLLDLRRIDPKAITDAKSAATVARNVSWRPREVDVELVARVAKVSRSSATLDLGTSLEELPLSNASWARKWSPASGTPAPKSMADVVQEGDLVLVRVAAVTPCSAADQEKGRCTHARVTLALEQHPIAESALVSIDPKTRGVIALVGGYDHRRSPFNRATQAKRQPGSSFKPFVYAAALEQGQARATLDPRVFNEEALQRCIRFTNRTKVVDSPEPIRDKWTGQVWQPRNFERDFFAGELTLRKALAESKNTVAVKLIADVGCEPAVALGADEMYERGLEKVKDFARRAGIDSPLPSSITAALGSGEVIPLELVNAYATLAMNGKYGAPLFVKRVVAPDGTELFAQKPSFEQQPPQLPGMPPTPYTGRGVRPEVAFVASDLMRSVVEDPDGTARSLQKLGRPIAGKTGTASEHRDAWFVGFTPEAVTGVWVGFDDHEMLGPRETGGHAAGPIWLDYMQKVEDKVPHTEWEPPTGVVVAQIDPRTAMLAEETSPYIEREVYLQGTEPTEVAPPSDEVTTQDFLRGEGP